MRYVADTWVREKIGLCSCRVEWGSSWRRSSGRAHQLEPLRAPRGRLHGAGRGGAGQTRSHVYISRDERVTRMGTGPWVAQRTERAPPRGSCLFGRPGPGGLPVLGDARVVAALQGVAGGEGGVEVSILRNRTTPVLFARTAGFRGWDVHDAMLFAKTNVTRSLGTSKQISFCCVECSRRPLRP